MKEIFILILIICLLVVGGVLAKVVLFPVHIADKVVNTAYEITDKTLDANNVIANYEWFKQQYEDYIAIQVKYDAALKQINQFKTVFGQDASKWRFETVNEYSRLSSIAEGIKYQLEDMKSEYNAKSKMLNRNIFKDKNLPYQLD